MCNVWPLASPHCAIICSLHFPSPWGAPHRPSIPLLLYHCMLQAAEPLSILNTFSSKVVQGKGFLQTHIENRPKVRFVAKH